VSIYEIAPRAHMQRIITEENGKVTVPCVFLGNACAIIVPKHTNRTGHE